MERRAQRVDPQERIRKLLLAYDIQVADSVARQLFEYHRLLQKWNTRINLTGSTGWESLKPLFGEALWAAGFDPSPLRRLDIGSGAGFPAIPLQIIRPSLSLDLVESREKRAVFLQTVVQSLRLAGVRVHSKRLKTFLEPLSEEPLWDWVSWKGIKLDLMDLRSLLPRIERRGQLWVFHGRELPVSDPKRAEQSLELVRRTTFPDRPSWQLSMYRPR